jgi:predicted nucleic acid-binding protein
MSGALKKMSAEQRVSADVQRASVFLDTNVLVRFLEGGIDWLFGPAALQKFSYAINPVVWQELVLRGNSGQHTDRLESVWERTELLPIDSEKASSLLRHARDLRTRAVHSNDLLILSSAADCDYFVTDDLALRKIEYGKRPKVLSSAELRRLVEANA